MTREECILESLVKVTNPEHREFGLEGRITEIRGGGDLGTGKLRAYISITTEGPRKDKLMVVGVEHLEPVKL